MDYELIEELRSLSKHVPEQMCDLEGKDPLERAATAIETLLAERDAAVEDMLMAGKTGRLCYVCGKRGKCNPCACEGWQWRGPVKGNTE